MEEESLSGVFTDWHRRQCSIIRAAMLVDDGAGSGLQVRLTCAPANLIVTARIDDLSVWAVREDQPWDMLLWQDARPESDSNAWRCGICDDESKT